MSHGFEEINGKVAFVSAKVPGWHLLGETVSDLMTRKEITEKVMPWLIDKINIQNELTGEPTKFWGLYRDDTCELLHVVGEGYEVTQNFELGLMIDELIGVDGIHYETAGVLGRGEKIFATAYVGEFDLMATGDKHTTYLAGINSHDGSISETYKLTETRIVCQNTLNAALRDKNGREMKFKHTKNAKSRKAEAVRILQASRETQKSLEEKFEILAQRQVNSAIVGETIATLFNIDMTQKLTTERARVVENVVQLFENNDGNAFPEFKNTAYNLFNAVTEYTDHFRSTRAGGSNGTTAEKQRAFSSLFGSGDKIKQQGIDLVLELTKDAPLVNQPKEYSYETTAGLVSELLGANN